MWYTEVKYMKIYKKYMIWYFKRPMNYLSIGGKSVIKNDQSKLTRWDVIIYDMEVPGKPFKE